MPILQDVPVSLDRRSSDQQRDQRQSPRLQLDHAALITIAGEPDQVFHGVIQNISDGGTQIWIDRTLPYSTLVKIEYDDNILLGEIIYCRQEQSGWLAGAKIEHGLFDLTALAAAMQGF